MLYELVCNNNAYISNFPFGHVKPEIALQGFQDFFGWKYNPDKSLFFTKKSYHVAVMQLCLFDLTNSSTLIG